MDNDETRRIAREKALFLYSAALDRGDLETLDIILAQAETDAELDRLITEMNTLYDREYTKEQFEFDAQKVRQLLQKHLLSAVASDSGTQTFTPLTVSDVAARIQADRAIRGQLGATDKETLLRLRQDTTPLPSPLTAPVVRQFFSRQKFAVSDRFQKVFRDEAISMSLGREQEVRLAARRQSRQLKDEQL